MSYDFIWSIDSEVVQSSVPRTARELASFESCKGSPWWIVECLVSRDKCPQIQHGPRVFLLCESEDEMKEKVNGHGLARPYRMYEAWAPNDKRSNVLLKMVVEARNWKDAINQWNARFEKYKKNEWRQLYYMCLTNDCAN